MITITVTPCAFDLTADLGEDNHFNRLRQGNVRIGLKFSEEIAATVIVIAYAEFEKVIEVDRDRNVVFNFLSTNTKEIACFLTRRL